jgi:spore coat protein U-like protein
MIRFGTYKHLKPNFMAAHTITMTVANGTTSPLILADDENHSASTTQDDQNFTTNVGHGDTVTWNIGTNSSITKIQVVEVTGDLFSSDPAPADGGTSVTGTISSTATGGDTYTINYWIGDTMYSQDPKLQMN